MGLQALLKLDLQDGSPEQKEKFNELLIHYNWKRIDDPYYSWKKQFEFFTCFCVLFETKKDIYRSVDGANITNYKASVKIGDYDIEEFGPKK